MAGLPAALQPSGWIRRSAPGWASAADRRGTGRAAPRRERAEIHRKRSQGGRSARRPRPARERGPREEERRPPSAAGSPSSSGGGRWSKALTSRAPGTRPATISLEARPVSSAGLNSGASIGLLASIAMRPPQSGGRASAPGSFDRFTATRTMSCARSLLQGAGGDRRPQFRDKVPQALRPLAVRDDGRDAAEGAGAGEGLTAVVAAVGHRVVALRPSCR